MGHIFGVYTLNQDTLTFSLKSEKAMIVFGMSVEKGTL